MARQRAISVRRRSPPDSWSLDEAFQFIQLIVSWFARHLQHTQDIVLYAHLPEHRGFLCQIADAGLRPFVDGIVGDFLVVQVDVSCIGHNQSGCHIERGGLAGTVWSEQSHNLSLLHADGHIVHHRPLAVFFH